MKKESAGLRRNQQESIVMMQFNARNCRNDPCDSSEVGFDSFLFKIDRIKSDHALSALKLCFLFKLSSVVLEHMPLAFVYNFHFSN